MTLPTCALGAALCPSGVESDGELVEELARGDAGAVLAAVDARRSALSANDVIVFALTYEACCALDVRTLVRSIDTTAPAAVAWRARLWPTSDRAAEGGPRLMVSTTAAARAAHLARLAACRKHLLDGVVYQANLAHRLHVAEVSRTDARAFFARCRRAAPCAALVDFGDGLLVSLSPERFVEAELDERDAVARTYPIKGTVRRGHDEQDDARVAWLRASDKDCAEHVMIVDLLRNDLGRVAVAGGVVVESLMHVVGTSSVWHLESRVSARLQQGVGVASLMAATAPGGSITGAPKSSAIDVIAELEAGPRGLYTGVLGVVDGRGRLRSSLLIRTWWRPDRGPGALHVGGGVVVDSDPEAEWQETLRKAEAFGAVTVTPDSPPSPNS